MSLKLLVLLIFSVQICHILARKISDPWHYECCQNYCVKKETTPQTLRPLSFAECNLLCLDAAGIWPRPTGKIWVANLTPININDISLHWQSNSSDVNDLVNRGFKIFRLQLKELFSYQNNIKPLFIHQQVNVDLHIKIKNKKVIRPKLNINEGYKLTATLNNNGTAIKLESTAETYFGARNGLETLSQLIIYDDIRSRILMPSKIYIEDQPKYLWRGLMLDTARNFIPLESIQITLKAMSISKLNTFHWHLTDSQSFPYVSKSRPELSRYGAYSSKKIYDDKSVRSVIEYARVRGIRVVPEVDAPAHVGEGWLKTNVVTCFGWQPWQKYCSEPPCGQFDPSQPHLYDILEDIYGDILDQFGTEVFHMGGDEVNYNCWNNTSHLKNWMATKGWGLTTEDFLKVWGDFQNQAVQRLYKKAGKEIPVILWTSDLTALTNSNTILPNNKYYIQVWDSVAEGTMEALLNKNYSIILSNYDNLYLDCGYGKFTNDDTNWCSPYKTWQQIYENKPINIVGSKKDQILGGETALWTETAGAGSVDSRIWPRAAALAEALWSEPSTFWSDAEERMHLHRERLVNLGINADALVPEWCLQNQQKCDDYGKFNQK